MARPRKREGRHPISAVAKKYGLHPQTLRLYEREGLLKPARTEGRTRLYDAGDLERIEFILRMTRDLGVNLAGVQVALQYRERILHLETTFTEVMRRLAARMPPPGAQTPGLVRWRPSERSERQSPPGGRPSERSERQSPLGGRPSERSERQSPPGGHSPPGGRPGGRASAAARARRRT